MPSFSATESYSQDVIDIDKYRKVCSKFPDVKKQCVKHSPGFVNWEESLQHIKIFE